MYTEVPVVTSTTNVFFVLFGNWANIDYSAIVKNGYEVWVEHLHQRRKLQQVLNVWQTGYIMG